jgi:hypothetical protein
VVVRVVANVRVGKALLEHAPERRLTHPLESQGFRPQNGEPAVAATATHRCARHLPEDAAVVHVAVAVVMPALGEDRLEMRWTMRGGQDLDRGQIRDSDHADVAVTPVLCGDPFDDVVNVPSLTATAHSHDAGQVAP